MAAHSLRSDLNRGVQSRYMSARHENDYRQGCLEVRLGHRSQESKCVFITSLDSCDRCSRAVRNVKSASRHNITRVQLSRSNVERTDKVVSVAFPQETKALYPARAERPLTESSQDNGEDAIHAYLAVVHLVQRRGLPPPRLSHLGFAELGEEPCQERVAQGSAIELVFQ